MIRKLVAWCFASTMGLGATVVWSADPPPRPGETRRLPLVINVKDLPELTPSSPRSSTLLEHGWDGDRDYDCADCQPHFLLPGLRSCRYPGNNYWHNTLKPRLQSSHWGYCDQFCETPFGVAAAAPFQMQVANGLGSQMMLYEYDFQELNANRGDTLSARGRYQLEKIAQRFLQGLGPIVIATTFDNAELDDARRRSVEVELKKLGVAVAARDVQVGRPPGAPINGYESIYIQRNRESLMLNRGASGLSGSGGGATSGGASGGATTGGAASGGATTGR